MKTPRGQHNTELKETISQDQVRRSSRSQEEKIKLHKVQLYSLFPYWEAAPFEF